LTKSGQRVLVDTNILLISPRLDSGAWRALRWAGERGEIDLYFPEVCLIEAISWYEREWTARLEQFYKAQAKLNHLGIRFWQGGGPDDQVLAGYGPYLRERLTQCGTIVPIPSVDHETLVRRASSRQRPFNEHGSGYRDALIWENACELAKVGPLVLLTQNSRDFGTTPDLHDDLKADLLERGIGPEQVSVEAQLSKVLEPLSHLSESIRQEAERALGTKELLRRMEEELAEWFSYGEGMSIDPTSGNLPAWFVDPVAEGLWQLSDVAVSQAVAADEDGYLVSGSLRGETRVFSILDLDEWASLSERERNAVDEVDTADRSDVAVIVYQPAVARFEAIFTPPKGVSEVILLDISASI